MWTVAAARLILGSDANLQVPPNLSANDYQIYLNAGINDWGGVSPLTIDFVNPEAPWPVLNDLKKKTEDAGFELKPRLPVYPEYFIETEDFLPASLQRKVSAWPIQRDMYKGECRDMPSNSEEQSPSRV
ncbi:MAG: hypothetical protein CM1200mP22_28380 [Dehalococcoidia bacterium]|nr:MAG: hypothetical protein CM1200mP22_28380 [Dehalococcoidia bacterium]